jgi:hypothetical protein
MHRLRRMAALVSCFAAAGAATLASASVASAHTDTPSTASPECLWGGPITATNPADNFAFPDSGASYWYSTIQLPAGAQLLLHGRFAHARYQSLTAYNAANATPTDALNDVSTVPDRGSVNPFQPGAPRFLPRRSYTITVTSASPPAAPAPNTLYAGVAGQNSEVLMYRVYVPDRGRDLTGGVGLPRPEVRLADGQVLRGQAACGAIDASTAQLPIQTLPPATYAALRNQPGKPPTFPASNPPIFRAFYNTNFLIDCGYLEQCGGNPARTGGQYSNVDNAYVSAFLNRGFGSVLVLRGKLPTTPRTYNSEPFMGTGQMRYWSICQNESLATTRGAGCLYDEQIPVDRRGYYTIVTSLPADRPSNATTRCGVGYLPWPADGDGAGHPDDALLIVRNMLPAPSFHHAVQDTTTPGDEAAVMGPYLPTGQYMTTAQFEARGCR